MEGLIPWSSSQNDTLPTKWYNRFAGRRNANKRTGVNDKIFRSMQRVAKKARVASKTRTTVEKRTTPQVISNNGESKSSFSLIKPITSRIGKLTKEFTPCIVMNNEGYRTEALDGLQVIARLGDYFTDTDVNTMFASVANTPAAAQVFLRSVRGESMIKNQCDVTARIKIYDVLCKMTTDATTTDPLTAFSLGFADITGGAAANYAIPGATPYSNPRFMQYFKILNKTDVVLTPGATHLHVVDYKPSRMISHISTNAMSGDGVAGLTLFSVFVYFGAPINAVSTQTEVTTSAISLDVVNTKEYRYSYIHPTGGAASITNSLDLALSSAGATMQADGVELAYNDA